MQLAGMPGTSRGGDCSALGVLYVTVLCARRSCVPSRQRKGRLIGVAKMGKSGNWTRDLLYPKQESYH